MLTINVWFRGLSSCRLRKVVLFHTFHSLFSICCWLWNSSYGTPIGIPQHGKTTKTAKSKTLIPTMTRARFKHRLWWYLSTSTFNNLFISRFHLNPKLTAKILSSRCAVMSSLALPPCWSWKMLHIIGTHTMSLPSPSPAQLWGKKMASTYRWSRSPGSMIYDNEIIFCQWL